MMPASCIYAGHVIHHRLRPRTHHLAYRCFWFFVDLDQLGELDRSLRYFSFGKFNLFSIKNQDFGNGGSRSLRDQAIENFARAGIETTGAKIFLLTMPRVAGYVFNPISIYYCYQHDGALEGLMYEVHNTVGERHSYLIASQDRAPQLRQSCSKRFYVSPFLKLNLDYCFDVREPGDNVRIVIRASDAEGALLMASLSGQRSNLTDRNLLKHFVRFPLLTLKVIAAIHWEALRLWWKGIPVIRHTAAPQQTVTISTGTTNSQADHV